MPARLEEGQEYSNYLVLRRVQEVVRGLPQGVRLTAFTFFAADGREFRRRLWPWDKWHKVLRDDPLAPEPGDTTALNLLRASKPQ